MIDGVVRAPSEFSMTLGWPPSMMATQLLVVPRSIPMILAMMLNLCCAGFWGEKWGCHRWNQRPSEAEAAPPPALACGDDSSAFDAGFATATSAGRSVRSLIR